jgi:HD-GYP domain-containing protein (c-di-GMP phosphodiesterase class II)
VCYPRGISGAKIHLYGKIVAIADVFDAMRNARSYREPIALEEVTECISRGSQHSVRS